MTDERDDVAATLSQPELPAPAPAEDDEAGDIFEQIARLEDELEEEPAEDFDQILGNESAETAGREFAWPRLRGAHVHIAHFSAAIDRKSELEAQYRKRKGILPGNALSGKVEERLWEEAMFGTVVKGWRGMKKGGYELPFNLANYRMAMRVRTFRSFVLAKARDTQNFRDREREELSGN